MDLSLTRRLITRQTVAEVTREALSRVASGHLARLPLTFRFWDGSTLPAPASPEPDLLDPPTISVRGPRAIAHLLHAPGQLGLVRGYLDGSLAVDGDMEQLLSLRNVTVAAELTASDRARFLLAALKAGGPAVLRRPPVPELESVPRGARHSLRRDRQAVRHHYDVSNDFYRLMLGPTMVYSCAYYGAGATSLDEAQTRKLDLICRKLALEPGEHLLDIGCGWGSLVLHAVAHYGVRATGVTLSEPQARLARRRAADQGLDDRIEIRVADYRELSGRHFDKIASVGMYEHVGRDQLATYARTVQGLLRPGGLMLNHGIARLDSPPPADDTFISRYIFPDGELYPVTDLIAAVEQARLEVRDLESLREHYALTLRAWLQNLRAHRAEAEALVGAQRVRVWDLYLLGCAIAFDDADISVNQVLLTRLGAPHGLPLDRLELLTPRNAAGRPGSARVATAD